MGPGDGEPLLLLPPLPAGCDLVVRLSSKCLSETRCFPGTSEVLFLTGRPPMTKCVCCLYACVDIWGPRLRWNEWQLFWSCSKSSQKNSSRRRRGRTITWPDLPGDRTRTCNACMQGMSTERCHSNAEAMTRCDKQHTVCVHCGFQMTSQLMWSEPGKHPGNV